MDQHPNQISYPPYPPPSYSHATASTSRTAPSAPAPSQIQQVNMNFIAQVSQAHAQQEQQGNSAPVQVVVNQNQYYTNYMDRRGGGNGRSFLNRNWTPEWSREPRPSAPMQVAPEPTPIPTSTSAMAGSSSSVSSSAPPPPPYNRYAYGYDHNRNYTFHQTLAQDLEELLILDSNQTSPDLSSAIDVESDSYSHALDNCTVPFKYDAPEDFVIQAGYKLDFNTVRQQQEIDSLMEELTPDEIKYAQTLLHNYFNGGIKLPNDPNPPTNYIRDYWNYFICPFFFHGYREMEFAD